MKTFWVLLGLSIQCVFGVDLEWTALPELSSASSEPQVALFANGDGVALWTEDGGLTLKSAKFVASTKTWQTPVTVSTSSTAITIFDLVAKESEIAVASWAQFNDMIPALALYGGKYVFSTDTWTVIPSISDETTDSKAGFAGSDFAIFTATSTFPLARYIYYNLNDGTITGQMFDTTFFNRKAVGGGIAGSNRSNYVYVQSDFDTPTDFYIESASAFNEGLPVLFTQISMTADNIAPALAINATGTGIISWIDGEEVFVAHQLDFNANTWSAPLMLTSTSGVATPPLAVIDDSGNGVVVWQGNLGRNGVIQASFFDPNSQTWSSTVNVSIPPLIAVTPSVTVSPAGRFGFTWSANNEIQSRIYENGTWTPPLTDPATVIPTSSGGAFPDVSFADGTEVNGVVVWRGASIDSAYLHAGAGLNPSGRQVLIRYPLQGDLVNRLSWSPTSNAAQYLIYRFDLNHLIGTTSDLSFSDHQRVPNQIVTYYIQSVDASGASNDDLVAITVTPLFISQ